MDLEGSDNLVVVLGAWFAVMATGSLETFERILDDDVVWEGRYPGQICRTRQEVLHYLENGVAQCRRITRIEGYQSGDDVVVRAEGPDFEDVAPDGTRRPRPSAGMIFSIRSGRIVRMKGTNG